MRGRRVAVAVAAALALGAALLGPPPAAGAPPAQRQRVTLASPSTGLFELPAIVAEAGRPGHPLAQGKFAMDLAPAPPGPDPRGTRSPVREEH